MLPAPAAPDTPTSSPAAPTSTSESDGLVRGLGPVDATLLTVGSVVGTGIFLTSSDIVRALPHGGWLLTVWVVGGLLTLAGALTYAELGAMFPRAGGMYHYLKAAWGGLPAFLFGWACFVVIMSGGIAAIAIGFATYLGSFVPASSATNVLLAVAFAGRTWTVSGLQVAALLSILVITAVNHLGLRVAAGVQNGLTVLKIGALVLLGLGGLLVAAPTEHVVAVAAPALPGVPGLLTAFGVAMIAAMWTYDGWYGLTFSAGEARDPARTLPIGLVAGTALIMLLYVLVNVAYLRALPIDAIAGSPRVAEDAAAALFGPWAARAVSAAVLVSTLGCLAATVLYSSRIYHPMAEDGVFFPALARVDPRWHVPVRSLWAQSAWAAALTLTGTYEQVYTYVTFAAVLFHVATAAAVFVLRRTDPHRPRPYRTWGYPVVPALFILASLLIVANTLVERPMESLFGLGLLAVGLPAYAVFRRRARAAS